MAQPERSVMNQLLRRSMPVWLVLGLLALVAAPRAAVQPDSFAGVERIVAVGDVHGGYDELVAILRAARVIDGRNRWSGGRTTWCRRGTWWTAGRLAQGHGPRHATRDAGPLG